MTIPEIVSIVSGLASVTSIATVGWRAVARFTRLEDKVDDAARQIRAIDRRTERRLERLESEVFPRGRIR